MDQCLGMEEMFSQELVRAIGALFLTASAAEVAIGLQLLRVLSHPRPMDVNLLPATVGMELKVRLGIIRVTSARIAPVDATKISRACSKIQDAFEHRNNFAHNLGMTGISQDHIDLTILRFATDGSLIPNKPYHLKQIRTATFLIRERTRVCTQLGIPAASKL